jgi:beta-glucosidase
VNPSGHLPVTFYASTADLPGFMDYAMSNRTYRYFSGKPEFTFGHGLSYTKFGFKNGRLAAETIPAAAAAITVTFTMKNTGKSRRRCSRAGLLPARQLCCSTTQIDTVRLCSRAL